MENFDPASLGAVAVDDYQQKSFDPSSIGAVAVEEFDPRSLGAQPVEEEQTEAQGASFGDMLRRFPAGIAESALDAGAALVKAVQDFLPDREQAADPSYQPVYDSLKSAETSIAKKYEGLKNNAGPLSLSTFKKWEDLSRQESEEIAPIRKARESLQKNPNSTLSTAASLMRELSARAKGDYGVDPERDQAFLSKVASGAGSLVPVIASGPLAPITTAGMMGEGGRKDAEQMGATQEQQDRAFYANAAVGTLSEALLGIPALIRSVKSAKIPEATAKAMARAAAVQGLKEFFREGTQEAIEQGAQNAIARYIAEYDPERPLTKDVMESFFVGGAIGGPLGAATQTADILSRTENLTTESQTHVDGMLAETAASTPPAPITPSEATETPSAATTPETPSEPVAPVLPPTETPSKASVVEEAQVVEPETEPTPEVEVPQQQESPTPQEPPKVLTEDDRAKLLQPHLKAAQAAAEASGATDAESAVQDAWRKISNSEKPLDNPRAVLIDAARSEAKSQLSKANAQKRGGGLVERMDVAELEEAAVETRGPRAETVAKEDIEQITKAIETLNENETRVAKVLMRGEDLSNAEIAEELGLAVGTVKNIKMKIEEVFRPYAERMGFGQSLGPGAASAAEVLTQYEVRRFSERFQKSKDIDEDVREQTGNRYYEVLPNQVTAEKAREFFEQNPDTERAISIVMDERQAVSFADRAAIGQLLVKKINEERKALKTSDPEKADRLLDRVIEASEWLAEYGTRLGQGVQAFAMWNRLTPEGKLRSVQKEVQKTRKKFIRDNQKDVDEVHDILNEDTSMEVKRSKLSKSKSRTAKAAKKNLNKIPKKPTKEQLLDTLSKDLGLPTLTPEQQAEIMRLAEIAENAAEGMPKEDALNELNSYIAHIKGFHWSDLPLGIYYGNILSGIPTQAVNLVDTSLNVINEAATLAATDPKAATEIMRGLARGIETGRFDSLLALTKGRRISNGKMVETPFLMDIAKFGEEGGVPIQTIGPISSFAKKAAESRGAKYLNAYKYVGRAMAASDSVLFRSAQEAKAAQLAYRLASTLQGANLRAEVDRILGFDRTEEFLSQAEAEGYTGATARARATELMIQSRPEEIQKESADFASEATYNYKPYGFAGAVANRIDSFSREYPALKLIVPFTRIVANVFNRGINNTPYGAFRAWRGKSGDKVFTESERQMLNARAAIGTAAIGVIGVLAATGAIKLHGQGPPDEEKRKQLRQTGWKPYTIQIGDKYYTYTYTPIGLGLAAMGNFIDAARYKTFSDKDNLTRAAYAMQSVGSTLFSQSFLSGLSSLFEMLSSRPATAMAAAKRFASSTVSGLAVPFASLQKDVNQAFDPAVRETDNIGEAMIADIPIARTALKPALNALGEPVMKDRFRLRERFYSEQKEGPWGTVRELGLRIPTTGPFFENQDEDYEYAKKTGERIKGYLIRNEEMLRSVPQKVAQDSLENFADRVKKEVRGEMLYKGAKKKPKK